MDFFNKKEKIIHNKFFKNGYLVFDIDQNKSLNEIKKKIIIYSENWIKKKKSIKISKFKKSKLLDEIHNYVTQSELNDFRLYIYNKINQSKDFQKHYYNLGKKYIDILCGNELVMQKKCNLSIQMPNDDSSLLPLHADVWVGDSEYELVFWLPLVNIYKTKAMYILSPEQNKKYSKIFYKFKSIDEIYKKVKKNLKWININYGQGLLFTQNLMHGNIVNIEKDTRWSFNCRFKSILSPYRDKELGNFFRPITVRPLTILGMNYKFPYSK
jgi:sporadic carbohydrate cluster 2OG-Fe(II) oxygenase